MARIFITGSVDGLGQLAANALVHKGHSVVLHARNPERAKLGFARVPGVETVLTGDLSSMEETKSLAGKVNELGVFDAVIHNAGVNQVPQGHLSPDGLPLLLAVNTIAPYILTCLIRPPKRLIYLSSQMHMQADPWLKGLDSDELRVSYSDTKFHDLILAMAVARLWSGVCSNAVDPGWVPTRMGAPSAPDSLPKGYGTQVWLATSSDAQARVSGKYFHHQRTRNYMTQASQVSIQSKLLVCCEKITGVQLAV